MSVHCGRRRIPCGIRGARSNVKKIPPRNPWGKAAGEKFRFVGAAKEFFGEIPCGLSIVGKSIKVSLKGMGGQNGGKWNRIGGGGWRCLELELFKIQKISA